MDMETAALFEKLNTQKLWKVERMTRTKDKFYPFSVEGYNLETGERFSWAVPDVDDHRFDLSAVAS